jgi:hypothetical protein
VLIGKRWLARKNLSIGKRWLTIDYLQFTHERMESTNQNGSVHFDAYNENGHVVEMTYYGFIEEI